MFADRVSRAALLLLFAASVAGAQNTEIIDATGNGVGKSLTDPQTIPAGGSGNVFVTGRISNNAFQVALAIFADGFESGNISAWSASVP
jgi:hypothetical protein